MMKRLFIQNKIYTAIFISILLVLIAIFFRYHDGFSQYFQTKLSPEEDVVREDKSIEDWTLVEIEKQLTSKYINTGDYGSEYEDWSKSLNAFSDEDFVKKMSNTITRLEAERKYVSYPYA